MPDTYAQRKRVNDLSKSWAKRDNEPWQQEEVDLLITDWIGVPAKHRDEITISQVLERTVEACRVRCEHIRKTLGINVFQIDENNKTTERPYIGAHDEDEDVWWK